MAAAKLLSRAWTAEASVGMSMFAPEGPAHSNEKLGIEDGVVEKDTTRAPDMPVELTTRASTSASTASWARQPFVPRKRETPQPGAAVRMGRGMLTTASALLEVVGGHGLVTAGRMAAEVAESRLHVPDALVLSMHEVARVEMAGREI